MSEQWVPVLVVFVPVVVLPALWGIIQRLRRH